ncbi:MAG: DUF3467 domain-containing protein [Planctomycetia bacterium]|nr:DUF3467 domain-containing protein [Planctomycetia bacterium]
MSDEGFPEEDSTDDSGDDSRDKSDDGATGNEGHLHQQFQFQPLSARVPERVARGVFSTGAIVLQGPDEFLIDFILKLANPHQIVTRIVLPMSVVPRFIVALQENLRGYEQTFGGLPAMPVPRMPMAGESPPDSIEDLYDHLKMSDDLLGGYYANAVMIGHAPAEFCFDFIANLYPKSVVVSRVFMSSPQVPGLLEVLLRTWKKYEETKGEPPPEESGDDAGDDEE